MEKLGIIAGGGKLPFIAAKEAKAQGFRVVAVAIEGQASSDLEAYVDSIHWIGAGDLGGLISILHREKVFDVVMLGKIPLTILFSRIKPDLRGALLYLKLKDRRGDSILEAIAQELEKEGIILHETTRFLSSLLPPKGILTARAPSEGEWEDIRFGREIAKAIASLRIGQMVVVKEKAVLAVESAEGTDEAIRRGGALGRGGVVVVKVSRPDHDMRFDLPVVGRETVEVMAEAGAIALAVDTGKTLALNLEEMVELANANGIAIVAD